MLDKRVKNCGALATGQIRVAEGKVTTGFFVAWLTPFAFVSGLLVLIICAYLAATYLTVDPAGEPDVRNDFRRRALWSGGVLLAICSVCSFSTPRMARRNFFRAWKIGRQWQSHSESQEPRSSFLSLWIRVLPSPGWPPSPK